MCNCSGTGYEGDLCQTGEFHNSFSMYNKICFCFSLAVCDSGCQNGGTCSSPNTCVCDTGYEGDYCQTGVLRFVWLS